jgi:hypothetical protein
MGMIYWPLSAVCALGFQRASFAAAKWMQIRCCLARISVRRPLLLIYLILIIFSTHLSCAEWVTGWCGEHHRLLPRRKNNEQERRVQNARSDKSTSYYFKCYASVYIYMNGQRSIKNEWTVSVVWHPWLDHEIIWIARKEIWSFAFQIILLLLVWLINVIFFK